MKKIGYISAQRIRGGTSRILPLRFLDQNVLYVDPGGTGDYLTIQAAITAILAGALTGRTVLIAPGTYVENINFTAFTVADVTLLGLGTGVKIQGSVVAAAAVLTITGVCTAMDVTFENIEFEQLAPATNIVTCNATGGITVSFKGYKFTAQANTDLINWIPGGNSSLRMSGGQRDMQEECVCAMTIAATAGATQTVRISDMRLLGALTLNDADLVATFGNVSVGGNLVATAVNAADGLTMKGSHIVGSVTIAAGQAWFYPDVRVDGVFVAGLPNIWGLKKPFQAYTTAGAVALTEAEVAQYPLILIAGAHAVTLPAAAAALAGRMLFVSSNNAAATLIVAAGFHGGGAPADTITIGVGCAVIAYCDGTNWYATVAALAPA